MKIISINPSTEEVLWEGESATKEEVDAAIKRAREAFLDWSQRSFTQRMNLLEKYRDIIAENKQAFAETIAKETGKTLWEALGEVGAVIGKIGISIDSYHERCSDRIRENPVALSITHHKPHGVVAVFGPYNFPAHLPNGHIVPALLAGNTIVMKPSELTPLVAEEMVKYWKEAGLPEGVINLVQGGADVGKMIATHPEIDGIFFTGSWNTGKILSEQLAGKVDKILALELGGNNPLVIGDIHDLSAAAYLTVQSAYLTSGQRCTCARRLMLPKGEKGDRFLEKLEKIIRSIKVGAYNDDPEPFMGPVISKEAAKKLMEAQIKLIERGGKAIIEMKQKKPDSAFLTPGLIDVTDVKDRPDEEYFGPLLQVIRVNDLDEAIAEANNTSYGLAAGILSDSQEEYEAFYHKVKAGIINWNTPLTGASSAAPFGGVGHSGNHRPSAYYAADYCSYPVASMVAEKIKLPEKPAPGLTYE